MRKQENNKPLCKKSNRWKIKIFWISKMWNKKHHRSHLTFECGLDYDSGNEDEMFAMSSAISKSKYFTSTVVQKNLQLSPSLSLEQSKLDFSRTLHPTPVDNKNFPFGINWNDFSKSQLSKPLGTCSPGIQFLFQWMPSKYRYQ